jgi:diphthine methyl ester synthase
VPNTTNTNLYPPGGPDSTLDTKAVSLARLGLTSQLILYDTLQELQEIDFGPPLHSLIIGGGELHPLELEISIFTVS